MPTIHRLSVRLSARLLTLANDGWRRQEGQSLVEWSLILALVAVVTVTVLRTIGTNIVSKLTTISNAL